MFVICNSVDFSFSLNLVSYSFFLNEKPLIRGRRLNFSEVKKPCCLELRVKNLV